MTSGAMARQCSLLLGCLWPLLSSAQPDPPLLTPKDLMALPVEAPDHVVRYGTEPSQYGELRVPSGTGPHPVVVLVHGGCFRQEFADARSIGAIGDALKSEGIASWSIEYRRLSEPGSGWPGTYLDVADAIDHLESIAPRFALDPKRVVFMGHSAGAHLAHWAAARGRLEPGGPLSRPNPLLPVGVINLAGRMDMTVGIDDYEALCSLPVIRKLLGGLPDEVPERYAQVSVSALLPLRVAQTMIWGSRENFVPEPQVKAYVAAARAAGDEAELLIVPDAGHFETASPKTAAWPVVLSTLRKMLGAW
jgi:acetyl esterase/lipase